MLGSIVSSSRGLTAGRSGTSRGSPKLEKLVPRFPSRSSPEVYPAGTSMRDTFSSRNSQNSIINHFAEWCFCSSGACGELTIFFGSTMMNPAEISASRGCCPAVPPRAGNPSRGCRPAVPQTLEDTMLGRMWISPRNLSRVSSVFCRSSLFKLSGTRRDTLVNRLAFRRMTM